MTRLPIAGYYCDYGGHITITLYQNNFEQTGFYLDLDCENSEASGSLAGGDWVLNKDNTITLRSGCRTSHCESETPGTTGFVYPKLDFSVFRLDNSITLTNHDTQFWGGKDLIVIKQLEP